MSHRVVVWGPGNVGRPSILSILRHPALELAGVIVHSAEKEGMDAGELADVEATGVRATRDAEAALDGADALVYAASQDLRPVEAADEMCAALERGVNVVTAGLYGLLHPPSAPGPLRDRFATACERGGSSFLSSGIDPGFAMDLLPVVLSGLCQEIHEIRIVENFNYATYDVPEAVRRLIGFGSPMDRVPAMISPGVPTSVWGGSLRSLAQAVELEVDSIEEVVERHPLERDVEVSGVSMAKGTLGAFRFEVRAFVGGRPTLVVEHVTRIVDDTAPQWPRAEGMGHHRVRITGRPDIALTIESEDRGDHVAGGNATAAARIVNAIPFLCASPAGLYSGADLPPLAGVGRVVAP